MRILRRFARSSRGQDLVEYVLLLALMVIATTAVLMTAGDALSSVWSTPILGGQSPASGAKLPKP
jgi:Flp pilus assembly pilin Flp